MQSAIEFINISKRFGSLPANDNISFSVEKNSIHCIAGENGAGKSTLMKILFGAYAPDSGEFKVNGAPVRFSSPHDAILHKIGMLYQHFMLIDDFTVLENVILGSEPVKSITLDTKAARILLEELITTYSLGLDLDKKISACSISEQQKTEILKLLYRHSDIIIFDEPTAVLSPAEVQSFLNILRIFKSEGKTIILITHKLAEVKSIADKVTVLRRGKVVYETGKDSLDENNIARAIVGTADIISAGGERKALPVSPPVLSLKNITLYEEGVPRLDKLNLHLRRGEIYGICGVEGNGQNQVIDVISGINTEYSGEMNAPFENISLVPDDRSKKGMIKEFTIGENMILKKGGLTPVGERELNTISENIIHRYDVRVPSADAEMGMLSGGNQQKVIVAREIEEENNILIFSHPTRGVDISAAASIHSIILELRNAGKAVLVISSDLDEVINLSDNIGILYKGTITKEFTREEFDPSDEAKKGAFFEAAGKLMIGLSV
jgi:simple sugar transport system ATP-binding protein